MNDSIRFYRVADPFGFCSNFSPHPITIDGKRWPSSEHYFQAQKFCGTAHEEEIRRASSPMIAARMGRSRARPLRADWEQVKDQVMRSALRAKFEQHADLKAALLATAGRGLVEQTTSDHYWGCGSSGGGKNMLGRMLVELREQLIEELSEGATSSGGPIR